MTETRLREAFPAGTESGGLAIKETRSAEKALCSISEAGNRMGVRSADSCPKAVPTRESAGKAKGGGDLQSQRSQLAVASKWVGGGLTSATLIKYS